MSTIGREASVTSRFANQFKRACSRKKLIEFQYELSGQDSKVNADVIFNTLNNFVLIEFKSFHKSIKAENKKERVYNLCHRLIKNSSMENAHRRCHFVMWGVTVKRKLETRYTIYQDSVCRKSILKKSEFLDNPECPNILKGENLAIEISESITGLNLQEFLIYLQWLFSKERSLNEQFNGPISLIATSSNEYFDGLQFKSFPEFKIWAEPVVTQILSSIRIKINND
ncbi:TPA: hypothetical protein ACGEYH_002410 [Providencia rettgeri]